MAAYNELNPIRSVGGVYVPVPSEYKWTENDVSSADAGRTEDTLMHKEMIGRKVTLELKWKNITTDMASEIISAFTAREYFNVNYYDPHAGRFQTKTFYVGDRGAPLYSMVNGVWSSVEFNIIER